MYGTITSFHQFIIKLRKKHQFQGVRTVTVKSTGHEKTRFTVVLSCMADGTKLEPMVIFKRKTKPKITFPPGVLVHFHEKGWMDEGGVKLWIEKIWNRQPGGMRNERSLLIWDMFRSHITANSKTRLARNNTDIAVIPGGLTSVLQPLDVSLNKPFKDNAREQWNEWMMNGEKSFTKSGAMRSASLDVLCESVIKAWDNVKVENVIQSVMRLLSYYRRDNPFQGLQEVYPWYL